MSFPSVAPRRVARYAFAALAPTMMTSPYTLMLPGPVLGFVGHGYWSVLGPLLSERFPTNVRASGRGLGDGDTAPDWLVTQSGGKYSVEVRAERGGSETGRTYTILITATDASSNTSTQTRTVTVPKSQGKP